MSTPIQTGDPKVPQKKKRSKLWLLLGIPLALLLTVALVVVILSDTSDSPKVEDPGTGTSYHDEDTGTEGSGAPLDEDDQGSGYKTAKFNQTYTYDNGLKVSIPKIVSRPTGVIFTVKVTNSSKDPFDASGIELDASYGPDGKPAQCCMEGADDYIAGTILPGRSKTGTFGVELPRSQRDDVVVEITTDYDEEPAIFQGAIK